MPARRTAEGPRSGRLQILIASIVDPATARNGAGTVTRGWLQALQAAPLRASVTCVAVAPLSRARHRAHQVASIARSLVTAIPAKVAFTRRRALRDELTAALRQRRFDLVLVNGSDLLWLLPALPARMPRALIAHNVEHRLFSDQARIVARRRPWLAPLLDRERRRIEAFEVAGVRAVGHVACLSERDRRWAANLAAHTVAVPPLFAASDRARPCLPGDPDRARRVGFVGNMDWWPNREGLAWFTRRVWPQVAAAGLELHLFGKGTERIARGAARVVAHGEVSDVAAALDGCDVMVSPCFAGGGVSVKLAEAIHHGIPTIASSFSAAGLPLDDDPCLAVSDDAETWVRWLRALPRHDGDRRVSPRLSARFSIEAQAAAIAAFIERAAQKVVRPVDQ